MDVNEILRLQKMGKSDEEIIALSKKLQTQTQEKKKLDVGFDLTGGTKQTILDDDSFSSGVVRGGAEATARGIAFLDYLDNKTGLNLISDEFSNKNTQLLKHLEDVKTKTSEKGLTPLRKIEKKQLQNEYDKASSFVETVKAGGSQLIDTALNPQEWTTQGVVAGVLPTDPANLISIVTGGVGGKIITKAGGGILAKAGFGVIDGATTNAGVEYGIARNTGASVDEARKIATVAGTVGAVIPATLSTASAILPNMKTSTRENIPNKPIQDVDEVYQKIKSNALLDMGEVIEDDTKNGVIKKSLDEEAIQTINSMHEAEQNSINMHNDMKQKLDEAYKNGATLDEMMAIRQSVPVSEVERAYTKIINDGADVSPELAGFKILNVIEDTIRVGNLSPDDVFIKLREKGVKQDLARTASQSYKERNTDILVDFISNKLDENMNFTNERIKTDLSLKMDNYNKQIIADEMAWSSSLTKQTIDDFIDTNIVADAVNENQKGLIYELNKIGLVSDVSSDNVSKKFGIKKALNGAYDKTDGTITLDNKISNIDKMQTLTHEYIHSATTKLLHNKAFFDDVNTLMNSAKGQSKNKEHYGFKSPDEFVAEAFSNPYFAKELNDMKLTAGMQKRYGVGDKILSVWDMVVDRFATIIYDMTGKRFKINKDTYFESLNNMVGKQIQELEVMKSERIFNGESLKNDYLSNPKIIKATDFDNLKLHPRYDELLEMRKDVKAEDIKYDKRLIQRGTLIKDNERIGGEDNTFRVPSVYEKNYSADFVLTKQDVKNLQDGKITDELVSKVAEDLRRLDDNPDYAKNNDIDVTQSREVLGDDFRENYYINKSGELVDNGRVLFSEDMNIEKAHKNEMFGRVYTNYKHDYIGARDRLLKEKSGDAIGALTHKELGDIDLVYGAEGTAKSDGMGLAKIAKYHPEVLDNLQDIIYDMPVVSRSKNRINLESDIHKASIRLDYDGITKDWLLTAFEKRDRTVNRSTDLKDTSIKADGKTTPSSYDEIIPNKNQKNNTQGENNGAITNQTGNKQDVGDSGERGDSATNGGSINNADDGGDTSLGGAVDGVSKEDKRMDGQYSADDISGDVSKFDTDEVVQLEDGETFLGIKERNPNILFSAETVTNSQQPISKKYDDFANKSIDTLDKFFHGLDKKGNIKNKTNPIIDIARNNLVTNAFKAKEFVELLQTTKREKARVKVYAREIQDNLNTLNKEDSSTLVLALDGDIPKENLKTVLGDKLYPLYETLRKQIDDNANKLVEAGLLDPNVVKEDYVKRFYKEHLENKGIFTGLFGSSQRIDTKNFKRQDLTLEQRDKINQIRDAGYVVARTLLEQNRQLQKAKFLQSLADEFASDTAKDGFAQVPDNKQNGLNVWGKLGGKYVPQHIKDELDGIYRMEQSVDGKFARGVKDFTRWIKGTWTAGNPGTHLYNVLSNNLNLYLNGLLFTTKNGRKFGGGRGVAGIRKFLSKDTREAYRRELIDAGLYDDNFFDMLDARMDELQDKSNTHIGMQIINGMLFRKDSKFTQGVEHLYDMEDKVFRVFAYEETKWDVKVEKYESLNGKVKSFDKDTIAKIEALEFDKEDMTKAMNEARDMFVDYSKEVPPIVSALDNYMLAPFLRYTYLATIRQSKVAIKHPLRALAVGLFLESAIQEIFGDGEELNSKDVLKPDWMATGWTNFNMYGTSNFIKVGDTKEESTWFNQGRLVPGFRMFGVSAGLYGDIYNILKENKDRYGRELSNPHDPQYLKALKIMSKLSETILPPLFPAGMPVYDDVRLTAYGNIKKDKEGNPMEETVTLGGRYAQKLINGAMGSQLDRYGNPLELTDVVKQMFGLKLEKINKEDEATKKLETLSKEYKPKINREKSLKNEVKKKEVEKEYNDEIAEIKKSAGLGFDLGSSSNDGFGFGKTDFEKDDFGFKLD